MNGTESLVLHHLCWANDLYSMAASHRASDSDLDGHDQRNEGPGHEVQREKL